MAASVSEHIPVASKRNALGILMADWDFNTICFRLKNILSLPMATGRTFAGPPLIFCGFVARFSKSK